MKELLKVFYFLILLLGISVSLAVVGNIQSTKSQLPKTSRTTEQTQSFPIKVVPPYDPNDDKKILEGLNIAIKKIDKLTAENKSKDKEIAALKKKIKFLTSSKQTSELKGETQEQTEIIAALKNNLPPEVVYIYIDTSDNTVQKRKSFWNRIFNKSKN